MKDGSIVQQAIKKIRDKYAHYLVFLFIPLEIIPFLCEPDSLAGKAILLIKAALLTLLYLLYADRQKWYTHAMMLIACVSMGISTVIHGNAGITALVLIMFFALLTFPRIKIQGKTLRTVFFLLGCGAIVIVLLCMLSNYADGLPSFSWRGKFNTNTIGILLLAAFFYFESSLHVGEDTTRITLFDIFVYACILVLVYMSGCRSALLSLLMFVACFFLFIRTSKGKLVYCLIVIFSMGICFVMYFIQSNTTIMNQTRSIEILGKDLLSGREKIWTAIFENVQDSPIFGRNNEYIIKLTGLESAHNVFMGLLLSFGLVPCLIYVVTLFSLKNTILGKTEDHSLQMNHICFCACIVVTAFECLFTDNRLNFLYLPLLLTASKTQSSEMTEKTECDVKLETDGKKTGFACKHNYVQTCSLISLCITLLVYMAEPLALSVVHEMLPQVVDEEYLKGIGYDENLNRNVLAGQDYTSTKAKGVAWEWNGTAYDVIGETTTTTSFVNFYISFDTLPEWAIPGHTYHAIYEAEAVRLRICSYDEKGNEIQTIETRNSLDFTIPAETVGIIVRISLEPGEPAYESVMPIIYPIDTDDAGGNA